MMRCLKNKYEKRCLRVLTLFCLGLILLPVDPGWGAGSSGMGLTIHTDKEQYAPGEPIQLIMVLKNVEGSAIVTDQGFSGSELHRSLYVTDPGGITHELPGDPRAHGMPAPFFWRDKSWSLTEILSAGFVLSETIDDCTALFPVMQTVTGWFTLQTKVSFARYAEAGTKVHTVLGTLGELDHSENWEGTVDSNEIQVFVSPGVGAQFQVQVLDQASQALPQVPVKVFKAADIPAGYQIKDAWLDSNIKAVLMGKTDFQGWVTPWTSGAPCQPRGEYLAVAYCHGEYKGVSFEAQDVGWTGSDCSGLIKRQIVFGGEPEHRMNEFSVFAFNSVWVDTKAKIESGNIGVLDASPGPVLMGGSEVFFDTKAKAEDDVQIMGDSVEILKKASVFDLFYNDLDNKGKIRGEASSPLDLPLSVALPEFPEVSPGTNAVKVKSKKTVVLDPGAYGHVKIKDKGILRLRGGKYHFLSLNMDSKSKVICESPSDIRIEERLYSDDKVFIGPEAGSGLNAKDVVFYIKGFNGQSGGLWSMPMAVDMGEKATIEANIYVPNGTLGITGRGDLTGSFIGRDVLIGSKTKVRLDSAF